MSYEEFNKQGVFSVGGNIFRDSDKLSDAVVGSILGTSQDKLWHCLMGSHYLVGKVQVTCHRILWACQCRQRRRRSHPQWSPRRAAPCPRDPERLREQTNSPAQENKILYCPEPKSPFLGVSNIQMRRAGSWWTCRRARRRSCRWAARAWSWPGMAPGPAASCRPRWRGPPRWCPWTARTAGSAAPGCPAHPRTGRRSRPSPRTTWPRQIVNSRCKVNASSW